MSCAHTFIRKQSPCAWQGVCIFAWIIGLSLLLASRDGIAAADVSSLRDISFSVDKGTWMSLDVSPDGRTIVFDLLGDIYALPIDGGSATRVIGGPSFDSQPRFSPDGQRLVFVSDRSGSDNLWVSDTDGARPVQVTHEVAAVMVSPEWTPTGDAVVATRTRLTRRTPLELWRYPLVPNREPQLVLESSLGLAALGVAFGSNSNKVYFSQKPQRQVRPHTELGEYQLAALDVANGAISAQSEAAGGGLRPALSPDGRWLTYASRFHTQTGLRLRDLRSGEERWLVYPITHDDQEAQHVSWDLLPGYSFTPDSSAVVIATDGGFARVAISSGNIERIPFQAQVQLSLAPLARVERRVSDASDYAARETLTPMLSPDGTSVALSAFGRVWIVNAKDGTARRLTRRDGSLEFDPTWSADGRSILYSTWDANDAGHIFVARVSGGTPSQITRTAALYRWPTLVPGSGEIVALSSTRQAWADQLVSNGIDLGPRSDARVDLILLSQGGEPHKVATLKDFRRPHFGPERDRVYVYEPSREGRLTAFRLDGSNAETRATVAVRTEFASEPAEEAFISPQGTNVLVLAHKQVFALPVSTSATPSTLVVDSMDRSQRLSVFGADDLGWTQQGDALWSLGATLFVADAARGKDTREIKAVIKAPRALSAGTVALRGARVLTMKTGAAGVIDQGVIVVTDGRIVAVGPQAQVAIPAGARVIDLNGKTLMPGLIDAHAHFGTIQNTRPGQPWEFLATLAYGVTTVFDPSFRAGMLTHADMVETGQIIGPRIDGTGYPLVRDLMLAVTSLDDARALVRRYRHYYGLSAIKYYTSGTREQRRWLGIAAREQGLLILAEGNGENRSGIAEIFEGFSSHEHYFTFQPMYDDVVQLLARSGTVYTPTLLVSHGAPGGEELFYMDGNVHDDVKLQRFTPHPLLDRESRRRDQYWQHWLQREEFPQMRLARDVNAVRRAGGRISAGGHGQRQGLGMHWEIELLTRGGMSNAEALRTATLSGAENLGIAQDLGSIEVGKLADLIVLDRNPLEDIRHSTSVRLVMKGGRLFDADTLDELWPKTVKHVPLRYWGETPMQIETQ